MASQIRERSSFNGIKVNPSGRFASSSDIPGGSGMVGTPAETRDRRGRSLIAVCRLCLHELFLS